MKPPSQTRSPKSPAFALTLAVLASLAPAASAASMTITSGPTTVLTGGVAQNSNTFNFASVSPAQVKVMGLGEFTSLGGDSEITLSVSGLLSAVPGESISFAYDFNLTLSGGGTVNWTLVSALGPGGVFPGPSSSGGPILSTSSGPFIGTKSAVVPVPGDDVPWNAALKVSWTGATAGDTLAVAIPNHSIDFAVVPEPSSLLLLGLGGLLLARRRR